VNWPRAAEFNLTNLLDATQGLCGRKSFSGVQGRSWWSFYNKNRICNVKMQINVNLCLKFVRSHNAVSQTCVLTTL